MAKGQRSNSKKAVRAQRRQQPPTQWQEDAEARRYAALAAAVASPPVPVPVREEEKKEPAAQRPKTSSDTMQTDQPTKKAAGKRKGIKVGRVQKKHNKKKISPLWVSEFHKKKAGKQGHAQ